MLLRRADRRAGFFTCDTCAKQLLVQADGTKEVIREAKRRGWVRWGQEWFCPSCAWEVSVEPAAPLTTNHSPLTGQHVDQDFSLPEDAVVAQER